MPARKRHKPGGVEPEESYDLSTKSGRRRAQDTAAQRFAIRRQAEKDEERARAKAHREAAERENRRRELGKEKDRAADHLKEVRRRGGSADQRAQAEAAYRAALDAVLRDEQGLPPLSEEEAAEAAAADAPPDAEPSTDEASDATAEDGPEGEVSEG
ncbi:MAG: hypothetical protein ACR2JF_10340 [Iamia sp.]